MENTFHITVVIPAFNAAEHIERAIHSVLAQTYPANEVIVVNDGSTDDTLEIVRRFGGRVRLIEQANAGVSAARNAGIHAASGEWIAFLDADDEWLPNYLTAQTSLLSRQINLVWSVANYSTCSDTEHRISPFMDPAAVRRKMNGNEIIQDYLSAFCHDWIGHLDTTLVRKEVLEQVGCFDETLVCAEDIDLWWKIAYLYPRCGYLAEPLAIYHLSTVDSLTKKEYPADFYIRFISRHWVLSKQNNRQEAFMPAASKMLRLWIRGMLFDVRGGDIRRLISEFPAFYSFGYRVCFYLLTLFPGLTAGGCRLISKVVRTLHLRRRLVAPPRNIKSKN
ncbi:MAG: glycosyltransferase [Sedimentisphaerales bacterium]|nr:glycosyltransferase [Sedimentisphaerales bacterium]